VRTLTVTLVGIQGTLLSERQIIHSPPQKKERKKEKTIFGGEKHTKNGLKILATEKR